MIECQLVQVGAGDQSIVLGSWFFPSLPTAGQKVMRGTEVFDVIDCGWVLGERISERVDDDGRCFEVQSIGIYRVTVQDENFGTVREEEAA